MGKEPVRILIAGAAGKCGSVLARFTAMGELLGHGQPVILHMLDIPSDAEALIGLKKELENDAFPLIKGVVATTDVVEGCTGVNHAIIVGGFLWKEGMKRTYVMSQAIEQHAAANCKVMVAANHPYASVVIMREFAASIPEENITCTTRLEQNIALRLISERLSVPVSNIKNVTIRGNFSSTLYPDVNHATVKTPSGEKHVRELVADDAWLDGEFIATVQQHAAAIIEDGTLSSALFLASSACDHVRDLVLGTPEGTWVSMGVFSDGSYNVPAGLIHSFPVTCHNGQWMIVQGRSTDKCSWEKFFKIMICVVIVIFLFTTYSAVRGVVRGVAH